MQKKTSSTGKGRTKSSGNKRSTGDKRPPASSKRASGGAGKRESKSSAPWKDKKAPAGARTGSSFKRSTAPRGGKTSFRDKSEGSFDSGFSQETRSEESRPFKKALPGRGGKPSFRDKKEDSRESGFSSERSGTREEKLFRKTATGRGSKPSFRDKKEDSRESGFSSERPGREEKPFRKTASTRDGNPSFRGKKDDKPFTRKASTRSSRPTFKGKSEDEFDFDSFNPEQENNREDRPSGRSASPRAGRPSSRGPKKDFDSKAPRSSRTEGTGRTLRKDYGDFPRLPKKEAVRPKRKQEDDGRIRLNKYIANTGICSRREADELIGAGAVMVNGEIITEMGFKVSMEDEVRYGGQTLRTERLVYVLLNKPKDYITTTDDPEKRRTVMQLVKDACRERIYPVGRLDRETTGLLLLTNDGELTKRLTHPSYNIKKIYHVTLDKSVKSTDLKRLAEGFELEDGFIQADEVSYVGGEKDEVGIEIHSGRNRIVRRMFEHLGYDVKKLDRVYFAGLTKKDLGRGRWRLLTEMEINMLKMQTGSKRQTAGE